MRDALLGRVVESMSNLDRDETCEALYYTSFRGFAFMKEMTRRDFFKLTLKSSLGVAAVCSCSGIFANSLIKMIPKSDGTFFILVNISGGMDATLGLDPQVLRAGLDNKDLYLEYRADQILSRGNIRLGPAAAPLLNHYNDIAIINGISSSCNKGHEANSSYISSGSPDGSLLNLSLQFAKSCEKTPYGVVTNDFLDGSDHDLKISDTDSLIDNLLQPRLSKGEQSTREFIKYSKKYPNLISELPCIASSFICEKSFAAALRLQTVDSHKDHPGRHFRSQKDAWTTVSDLFTLFKSIPYKQKSLFDRTTFLVVTEFSRTPYLNDKNGKDHNFLTNSALLAGHGVQGNSVTGESEVISRSESHTGKSIHRAKGISITPERIAKTVLKLVSNEKGPRQLRNTKAIEKILA